MIRRFILLLFALMLIAPATSMAAALPAPNITDCHEMFDMHKPADNVKKPALEMAHCNGCIANLPSKMMMEARLPHHHAPITISVARMTGGKLVPATPPPKA